MHSGRIRSRSKRNQYMMGLTSGTGAQFTSHTHSRPQSSPGAGHRRAGSFPTTSLEDLIFKRKRSPTFPRCAESIRKGAVRLMNKGTAPLSSS
jgi:hypothetical protein